MSLINQNGSLSGALARHRLEFQSKITGEQASLASALNPGAAAAGMSDAGFAAKLAALPDRASPVEMVGEQATTFVANRVPLPDPPKAEAPKAARPEPEAKPERKPATGKQARRAAARPKRPRRAKTFSDGRQGPLDRNARAKVMFLARAARLAGRITRAGVDIMERLVYQFSNADDGRCFPGYAMLAEAAGCDPRTVGRCLPDLEDAGLLSWCHRLRRVRDRVESLAGRVHEITRIVRTSNCYSFPLVNAKGHFAPETKDKGFPLKSPPVFSTKTAAGTVEIAGAGA